MEDKSIASKGDKIAQEGFNAMVGGFAEAVPAALESATVASEKMFGGEKDIETLDTWRAARKIRESLATIFPRNKELQDNIIVQSAEGLGNVGAMLLSRTPAGATAIGVAQSGSQEYRQALEYHKDVKSLEREDFVKKYAKDGNDSEVAENFSRLKKKDEDPQEAAFQNWLYGSAIGATESLPLLKYLKKVDKVTGGAVKNVILKKAIQAGKQGAEEALQEAFQSGLSNLQARETYDTTRELLDGVKESATVGGIVGITLQSLLGINAHKMHSATDPKERAILKANEAQILRTGQEIDNAVNAPSEKAIALEDNILKLQGDLQNPNLPEEAKAVIEGQVEKLDKQLEKEQTPVSEGTFEQDYEKGLAADIETLTASLADPALSDQAKAIIQERIGEKLKLIPKTQEDAVQIQSPEVVLQSPQEGAGETGSERTGVEPVLEGAAPSEESIAEPVQEGQAEDEVNPVLDKAENDLEALKQVANKVKKYEASIKRLTEAKKAGRITENEFTELKSRFDDVIGEARPKEEVAPVEVVAYHEGFGENTKGDAVYLESKEAAEKSSDNAKPYKVKLEKPFIVKTDADFAPVKEIIDSVKAENPTAKWHPDITSAVNAQLKEQGYDGLIIEESALESEKGYEEIGGTYGNAQTVAFDKTKVVPVKEETVQAVKNPDGSITVKKDNALVTLKDEDHAKRYREKGNLKLEYVDNLEGIPESEPVSSKKTKPEPKSVKEIIDAYEESENSSFEDLVNSVEQFAQTKEDAKLLQAVERYNKEKADDFAMAGRGDMESAEKAFREAIGDKSESPETLKPGDTVSFTNQLKEADTGKIVEIKPDGTVVVLKSNGVKNNMAPETLTKTTEPSVSDRIFDQSEVKGVVDFLEGLKTKRKGILSKILPVEEIYNGAIDIVITSIKAGNTLRKAINEAVKYLTEKSATKEEIEGFTEDMYEKIKHENRILYPSPPPPDIQRTEESFTGNLKKKAFNFYDNWLSYRKGLPREIWKEQEKTIGFIAAEINQAKITATKLDNLLSKNKVDTDLVDDALRGDQDALSELPENIAQVVVQMRAHVDTLSQYLIDNGLVSEGRQEIIASNIGEYLNRSYKLFNDKDWTLKNVPEQIYSKAAQFLYTEYYPDIKAAMPEATEAEVSTAAQTRVKAKINEYFNKGENAFVGNKKIGSKDLAILKKRKDVPVELRALFGEVTDPINNYVQTIFKMANLTGNAEFLTRIKNDNMGTLFFDKTDPARPETHHVEIASEGSDTLSPLNGLYTTPELAEAFQQQSKQVGPLAEMYLRLVSLVKAGKTVGSVITHIKNVEGNLGIALMNGHLDVSHVGEAYKTTRDDFLKRDTKYAQEIVQKLIKKGVLNQNIFASEVREMFDKNKSSEAFFSRSAGRNRNLWEKTKFYTGKAADKITKLYEAEDNFFKVLGYLQDRERYAKAQYGTKYETLTSEQQEKLDDQVTELIKDTYPTFSRVPKIARVGSSYGMPLFGNFVAFASESYRVQKNLVKQAYTEVKSKNPEIRKIGAQRLVGIGMYKALKYSLLKAVGSAGFAGIAGLFFDDEEERENHENAIKYVAPWSKNSDLIVLQADNGILKYVDLSSYDPFGNASSIVNAGTNPGSVKDRTGQMLWEFIQPFADPDITAKTGLGLLNNKDNYDRKIWEEADDQETKVAKGLGFALKSLEPGTISTIRRIYDKESPSKEFGAFIYRTNEVDVAKAFSYKLRDHKDELESINKTYLNVYYDRKATPEQKQKALDKANVKANDLLKTMYGDYQAALELGANKSSLSADMKNQRFNTRIRKALVQGGKDIKGIIRKKPELVD